MASFSAKYESYPQRAYEPFAKLAAELEPQTPLRAAISRATRAPDRRALQAQNAHVQQLRGIGWCACGALGPVCVLLCDAARRYVSLANAMVRRLGSRRWQQLHRLVYVAAIAGLLHFWWLVKLDYTRPLVYTAVIGALLAARIPFAAGTKL